MFADHPPQDALEVAHQRVEVDDPRLEHLLAAEGEELVGDGRRLLARLLDHLDILAARLVEVLAPDQQFRVAEDGGEQVVEVVRHAAGQTADRFHLLRLPELFAALAQGFLGVLALEDLRDQALALAEELTDHLRQSAELAARVAQLFEGSEPFGLQRLGDQAQRPGDPHRQQDRQQHQQGQREADEQREEQVGELAEFAVGVQVVANQDARHRAAIPTGQRAREGNDAPIRVILRRRLMGGRNRREELQMIVRVAREILKGPAVPQPPGEKEPLGRVPVRPVDGFMHGGGADFQIALRKLQEKMHQPLVFERVKNGGRQRDVVEFVVRGQEVFGIDESAVRPVHPDGLGGVVIPGAVVVDVLDDPGQVVLGDGADQRARSGDVPHERLQRLALALHEGIEEPCAVRGAFDGDAVERPLRGAAQQP